MRNKDFSALKEKKRGYKRFKAPHNVVEHRFESLFRTPRGWFLTYYKAERWLRECNIKYSTGW